MERQVFVGSSSEGLPYANQICRLLEKEGIQCVLWPDIFEPGSLTFEALEEMLMECCAAVFIATPDDPGVIRDKHVLMPRANVMLEFGLVAGRLGRRNIALCSFGVPELPSDLAGLTVIKMPIDNGSLSDLDKTVLEGGRKQLRRWCSNTLPTAERVPRTEVVHGYTGTWDFELQLEVWRGISVRIPNYAQVNGSLILWISSDGESGAGNLHGRLSFRLLSPAEGCPGQGQTPAEGVHQTTNYSTPRALYTGDFNVAHELQSVECQKDGGLRLVSRIYSIQVIQTSGNPLPELEGLHGPPEPWLFEWALACTSLPRVLEGPFQTGAGGGTQGKVKAVKRR